EAEDKAARTIRESEERLRLAFQAGQMGSWTFDPRTGAISWSPEQEKIFGLSPGGFGGRVEDMLALVHPEDRDELAAKVSRALDHGDRYENDYRIVRPDGTLRWITSRAQVHRDSQGKAVQIVGVVMDVSQQKQSEEILKALNAQLQAEINERKRAEQAVKSSEAQLRLITEVLPALVAYLDRNEHYQFLNTAYENWFGQPCSQFLGRPIADAVGQDAYTKLQPHIQKAFKGELVHFEEFLNYKYGRARWVDAFYIPDFDDEGSVQGIVILVHDVTDRKLAEDDLKMQALVLDSMKEGVSLTDEGGMIVYTNPAEDEIFGYHRGELIGKHVSVQNAYSLEENRQIVTKVISHLKTSGAWSGEFANLKKDGTPFTTFARINPIEMSGRTYFVCVQEDITARKKAEEALRASEEQSRRYAESQKFLVEAAGVLASSLDYEQTLRHVANLAVPGIADWCAVSIVGEDGASKRLATAHADPKKVELAQELTTRYPPDEKAQFGAIHVLRTGKAEIFSEIPDAILELSAQDPEHLALLRQLQMKSYMCLPLKAAGRTLGTITFVSAESGRRYGQDDLLYAERLAHKAAMAVENSRLYQKAQEAVAQHAEALALLDSLISTAPVGFAFLNRNFQYVKINGYLAALHGTVPENALGKSIWDVNPRVAPSLEAHYKRALETGEPLRDLEFTGESPLSPGDIRHWNVTYYPVYVDRVPGNQALREPIGVGVISADITDRKRAEENLRDEKIIVERLNQIGKALVAELDLEKLIQAATDAATDMVGAEFGAFFYNVQSESGQSFTLYTISGVAREAFSKFPMPRKTEIFAPTFDGTGIVCIDDVTRDPRYGKSAPYYGLPEGHLSVRSYLAVPVLSRSGGVIGGLFFGHSKPGVFSENDVDAIVGIAAQAAVAIDNANLFKKAQIELDARRKIEEEVRQLNDNLEKLVEERTAELSLANKELESFSYSVSHDLRAPLRGIDGFSHLLLERYEDRLDEKGRSYLHRVRAASQRMGRLIDDILNLSRVSRTEIQKQPIDLSEIARKIAIELSSHE
ncbi:MAG: PAS domain S-box protein, partial [Pseudobdellovibrionaceae bacterium]|nr:PAS domain S-box protein [Pseudobdellovibrionaceae bacterium]